MSSNTSEPGSLEHFNQWRQDKGLGRVLPQSNTKRMHAVYVSDKAWEAVEDLADQLDLKAVRGRSTGSPSVSALIEAIGLGLAGVTWRTD